MSDNQYNPVACEHKLPTGLTAWSFQSEEQSNINGANKVSIHVCLLCGEISIGGYRPSKDEKHVNTFHETFNIYHPDAIDAIIKQANFYNEEAKWGRLHPSESAGVPMRPEDHEQIEINKAAGMPENEASFQSGYTAGHDVGYEKGKREGAGVCAVWVKGRYDQLYEQVKGGKQTVCYVDYNPWGTDRVYRDICRIKAETMEFSSRGHGYGTAKFMSGNEKDLFIQLCESMNVEWLHESTAAQGKEDAAMTKEQFDKFHQWLSDGGYTFDSEYYYDDKLNFYTVAQLYDIYQSKNK